MKVLPMSDPFRRAIHGRLLSYQIGRRPTFHARDFDADPRREHKFLKDCSADIVVTDHAPSPRSVDRRFEKSLLDPAFVSNLDPLIEALGADLWVHGHTHTFFDYYVGLTRIVCNPRGYVPDETVEGFNPNLVVEV